MPHRPFSQVISASRRTELVAHYPDYLARRLRQLGPRNLHSVVVWTKDPANLLRHVELRDALGGVGQVFVHWTVTGLGGTFLEPNVPPPGEQLALLDDILAYVGDPRRVHWRYDPLISVRLVGGRVARPEGPPSRSATGGPRDLRPPHVTNVDLDLFRSLAEPFARAGVPAVHTSFVTAYPKVTRRLSAAGVTLQEFTSEERRAFLDEMAAAARGLGLELITCCEPGYPVRRCIDGELLAALHPAHQPCSTQRAKGQRRLCGCTVSLDVGHYLPCPNGCLYCYARPGLSSAASAEPAPPGVDASR